MGSSVRYLGSFREETRPFFFSFVGQSYNRKKTWQTDLPGGLAVKSPPSSTVNFNTHAHSHSHIPLPHSQSRSHWAGGVRRARRVLQGYLVLQYSSVGFDGDVGLTWRGRGIVRRSTQHMAPRPSPPLWAWGFLQLELMVLMPLCLWIYSRPWIDTPLVQLLPIGTVILTLCSTLIPIGLGVFIRYRYSRVADYIVKVRSLFPLPPLHS